MDYKIILEALKSIDNRILATRKTITEAIDLQNLYQDIYKNYTITILYQ